MHLVKRSVLFLSSVMKALEISIGLIVTRHNGNGSIVVTNVQTCIHILIYICILFRIAKYTLHVQSVLRPQRYYYGLTPDISTATKYRHFIFNIK